MSASTLSKQPLGSEGADYAVLLAAESWLAAGLPVLLVTVTRTWGSAPRPVGSMAALCGDGRLAGSVSGGCIEDQLVEEFMRGDIDSDHPAVREYGIGTDEAHRFGLPCGGSIQLVLEPITLQSGLRQLLNALQEHCIVRRTLMFETGKSSIQSVTSDTGVTLRPSMFQICLGRTYRLLLIGAGDLSHFVAQNAVALGYRVTVCEPREEYLSSWTCDDVTLTRDMPDDVVLDMKLDSHSAVVALTHDPKLDDLALMEALNTPAFYVAAIGSRKSQVARVARLKLFDLADEQLAKLHGPPGLYIGALTPPEIGISILAEMAARRYGIEAEARISVNAGKTSAEYGGTASHRTDNEVIT